MAKKQNKEILENSEGLPEDFLDSLSEEELELIAAELADSDDEVEVDEETTEDDEVDTVDESTEADVDGTAVSGSNYKTNMMSIAMHKLAGMSQDQVAFFLASLDQIGHEADGVPNNAVSKNQASIAMKGDAKTAKINEAIKTALKEDLENVFGDNKELSEELKDKMTVLFESAVNYRVSAIEQQLVEAYEEAFEEEVSELTDNLYENVNEYLTYTAKEWIKENEVAIEKSLKSEITEEFIGDLRDLFEAHNINFPEDQVEVAEALESRVEELEAELNEQIERNMKLEEAVASSRRDTLVKDNAGDLTVMDQEKFSKLAESIDYDGDDEEFVHKLNIIKESHFGKKTSKAPQTNIITEEITYSSDEDDEAPKNYSTPEMKYYVNALKRTVAKS